MLEIREEECIKTLESTDKPEIAQRELEIIKMSKELLREIITTGKIPQDIVRDKSVNDNEEIDDEHVDAENVNNGSRAAIKHKSTTEVNVFPVWLQNRLISAGLEPVLSHAEIMYSIVL